MIGDSSNARHPTPGRAKPKVQKRVGLFLSRFKKSRLVRRGRWLLLSAVLIGLGVYFKNNSSEFLVLTRIDISLIILVCLIHGLFILVSSGQFYNVARRFHPSMRYGAWTELFIVSRFLNRFFPQAGNTYGISALKLAHGLPVSDYLVSFAIFSIVNRITTAWCVVVTILLFEPGLTLAGVWVLPVASVFAIGSSLLLYLISSTSHRWGSLLLAVAPWFFRVELHEKFIMVVRDFRMIFRLCLWGVFAFILSVGVHALCFSAIGHELGLARLAILRFVKSAVDVITLTPGNFGVTESVYAILSKAMDDSVAAGIVVAVFMNITGLLTTSAMGLALLVYRGVRGDHTIHKEVQ